MRAPSLPLRLLVSCAVLAGCASSPSSPAPDVLVEPEVPVALRAPSGQTLYLKALANGVQIYECAQKADATYDWAFKAPEASLSSAAGQPLGRHYAGPTWESGDGSAVVGVVKAKDAGPKATAIPWLLLAAKRVSGNGTFSVTKSIQRVATAGGVAPPQACTGSNLGQLARVPYTATYYFYR